MHKSILMLRIVMSALFLIAVINCAASQKTESTGEYLDDSVITAKIKALIAKDENLKAFQISVETFRGVVQLAGFVDGQTTIDRAGQIAQSVTGVKSVKNNITLK
jgi:osmotically-inducible protein OsmY